MAHLKKSIWIHFLARSGLAKLIHPPTGLSKLCSLYILFFSLALSSEGKINSSSNLHISLTHRLVL